MTTWTYLTIRHAPPGAYLGVSDGHRHVLASLGDPGVPAAAQRRLNVARGTGRRPLPADMDEVSRWLDRNCPVAWVQGELFAA